MKDKNIQQGSLFDVLASEQRKISKLERLIAELCPDGVEFKLLAEIAEIGTGSSNTNEALEEGRYPFFVRSPEVKRKNNYEYDETAM